MTNEFIIFDAEGLKISNQRVVTTGETYYVRSITSVRKEVGLRAFKVCILLTTLFSVSAIISASAKGTFGDLLLPIIMAVITYAFRPVYMLTIGSAGGERKVFSTRKKVVVDGAIDAIHQAIQGITP
jgi:hypothetical protein